jgi:hypothetical protein
MGDGHKKYRREPFVMLEGGLLWHPPQPSSIQRGILNHSQRKYFTTLLSALSRRKHEI